MAKPLSHEMNWQYHARSERSRWLAEKYKAYLIGSVLDVGCWERDLRQWLPSDGQYVGIDIAGDPDQVVDLESGCLPFPDASFDCVVCADVLEHLEHIHQVFDELIRVSRKWVILSLPNNAGIALKYVVTGSTRSLSKYGLPPEPPADRHRWFFNYSEAAQFVRYRVQKNGARVAEEYAYGDEILDWRDWLKHILIPSTLRRRNLFAMTCWMLLDCEGKVE